MRSEFEKKLIQYRATMAMFKRLLKKAIITAEEYAEIDTIIAEKYGVKSSNIFR